MRGSDKHHVIALSAVNSEAAPAAGDVLRRKALCALGDLPPFSATLNRLMASLAGENISFAHLGDLIEKDTVVAGNVLNLVNSARYARRGAINSVRHALSILGIDKIRNAVLGMSLTRIWSHLPVPAHWSMARFNQHSAATALLSDQLAQRLPANYPEGAFVAGLLHDLGLLLIAMTLGPQDERIRNLQESTGAPRLACEMEVLGFTHPMLSADALAIWNIPEPIRVAVLYHHESDADPSSETLSLSRVIEASNQYVNSIGVSVAATYSGGACLISTLGLDEDARASALQEFQTEFEIMAPFFR